MPDPNLIAMIVANGQQYSTWTTVRVERTYDNVVSHMRFTTAEIGAFPGESGPGAWRLTVGDKVQGFLAGIQVIDGIVSVRQVVYTAEEHAVEIIVMSLVQNVVISTVDGVPGQYLNMSLQQIASAVYGKVGVGFSIANAPGAGKIFPRISEQIGETRFDFIERLCRMRNVHQIDNGSGNVVATRQANGTSATLTEGVNIWRARMIMKIDESADFLTYKGQMDLHDGTWENGSSSQASTNVPDVPAQRPLTGVCEINADNQDCQFRVNHERDQTLFSQLDVVITVQGWFMDSGDLWIKHVNDQVTVVSPMLFPDDTITLYIRGVIHKQSNEEGTTTDLILSFFPGADGLSLDQGGTTQSPSDTPQ